MWTASSLFTLYIFVNHPFDMNTETFLNKIVSPKKTRKKIKLCVQIKIGQNMFYQLNSQVGIKLKRANIRKFIVRHLKLHH